MRVLQTGQFKKAYKKLHPNQLPELNTAIAAVIENPALGEQKHGDLSWLRVYKFKILGQLTLLGYSIHDDTSALTLMAFGPHENFYRDLKR